jgi:hypothetical protein
MYIMVREEAQQTVSPKGFWVSVGIVTLLLGWMGVSFMKTGKVPDWGSRIDWLFLVAIWVGTAYRFVRFGRRAFPLPLIALLIGSTLTSGGHALPHTLLASSRVQGIASLCMLAGIMSMCLQFGGRRSQTSDGDQSNSTD